eukprot:8132099-Pyramimonas_sp.AAC.1
MARHSKNLTARTHSSASWIGSFFVQVDEASQVIATCRIPSKGIRRGRSIREAILGIPHLRRVRQR